MCTNTYRTLHVIFVLRVTLSTANLEPNGLVYVSWFLEVLFANLCVRYCIYVWVPWSFRRITPQDECHTPHSAAVAGPGPAYVAG